MPKTQMADLFYTSQTPSHDGVLKRFFRLIAMLLLLVGLLALAYYVIHNLPWWGFMIMVIIVLAATLIASSRCQQFVRSIVETPM
jgi:fatty acid desaturase